MKQTAVEWLYNNLKSHFEHDGDLLECVQMSMQQAKEMEKEQIIDAFILGELQQGFENEAEQYYNETFNTNEK
jgi:flagellar biosynthesis protein FliP